MTPKSTLRHKKNVSSVDQFINSSTFHRILRDEISVQEEKKINRVLLCSGKIYFELQDEIDKLKKENVFILRIDQLYPFPYDVLKDELKRFPEAEVYWVQEEPSNMGAFRFIKHRVESVMASMNRNKELLFIGRKASASPATGILDRHIENQKNILRLAIEADKQEIISNKDGVSLVKFKLPIE